MLKTHKIKIEELVTISKTFSCCSFQLINSTKHHKKRYITGFSLKMYYQPGSSSYELICRGADLYTVDTEEILIG